MRRVACRGDPRVAVLALALLLPPRAALAHAQLEGTTPERGAVVKREPAAVIFRFDEPVEGNFGAVRVYDANGSRVDEGDAFHPDGEGPRLGVHLKPGLPDGSYTATYRVVSADGHIVSSGFVFSIGKAGKAPKRDGGRTDRRLGQRPGDRDRLRHRPRARSTRPSPSPSAASPSSCSPGCPRSAPRLGGGRSPGRGAARAFARAAARPVLWSPPPSARSAPPPASSSRVPRRPASPASPRSRRRSSARPWKPSSERSGAWRSLAWLALRGAGRPASLTSRRSARRAAAAARPAGVAPARPIIVARAGALGPRLAPSRRSP